MNKRAYNFNAGPAALPLEVLEQAQQEFVEYKGIGMSIMEISHRSKEYEAVNDHAQSLLRELLNIPSGYQVLFMQGGASTQFAMLPMNFLTPGKTASYVMSGSWAEKAIMESKLFGETHIAASSTEAGLLNIPSLDSIANHPNAAYLHITSNETIAGTQYTNFPQTGGTPLFADMSSDILSRKLEVSDFAVIYAGAQKNLGPSGVTVVIIRDDLALSSPKHIPTMLQYATYTKNNSLYNTPPVYSVYMMQLVLEWIKAKGGLGVIEQINQEKTDLIYGVIDQSGGFYKGMAQMQDRSRMNITFKLNDETLEKKFIAESENNGFIGLKGHRSVGHLRASTYNAVPYESCKALVDFMISFMQKNG